MVNSAVSQQARIGRAVWYVTSNTAFRFNWCMFEREWTLLIRVALNASGIYTSSQSRLLKFETTMRVVAVTTAHCTFQYLVVER